MNKIEFNLKNRSGIYFFINLTNGKRYVGSSIDIYNRLYEHLHNLETNKAHNKHFLSAWNKYGKDNFIYGILEFCNPEIRFEREQHYIDSLEPEYNFTLQVIPNLGISPSQETRDKISQTLKEKYASGELQTYRQEHAWVKSYLYNVKTFKLEKIFSCINDANKYLGYVKHTKPFETLLRKTYILSKTKFKYKYELQNYINEKFLVANSKHGKYIITEDSLGNITYHQGFTECAESINSSRSTLQKHTNATKENPYIIKKSNYKFYLSNTYYPIAQSAVLVEESPELQQTENGEICDDNPVLSSEIKESEPVLSVEIEPEKPE